MIEEVAVDTRTSVLRARRWADFADWLAPPINTVHLQRRLSPALQEASQAALDELRAGSPWLATLSPDALEHGLESLAAPLRADIARLAELLHDLTGCAQVGVRLTRVETPMCCRWHVDWVSARLVTAYVGPGSELVSGHQVDRSLLGSPSLRTPTGAELLRPGARVRRAVTGEVVLLKGERWPGNMQRGAVHRSPHASPEAPRLLLTLDALF
jgi:hypothetical protein